MALMFSYPIKRQKITYFSNALGLDFLFPGIGNNKTCNLWLYFVGSQFMVSSFPIDYDMASLKFYVPALLLNRFLLLALSFIALFIGLAIKSTKATIISSFLLIILTQANIGDLTLANNAVFPLVLTIISLLFAVLSVIGVEKKDFI